MQVSGGGCYLGVMYRQTLLARFDPEEKADFLHPRRRIQFFCNWRPLRARIMRRSI